jgi:integrase
MPRISWSARAIQSKCLAVSGKRLRYTFEGVEGLVLERRASGKWVWLVRYRVVVNGQRDERKMPLGVYDPELRRTARTDEIPDVLTPGQAREKAQAILSQVRAGGDPWMDLKGGKLVQDTTLTFDVAFRRWVDENHPQGALKLRTRKYYLDLYRLHVGPRFDKRLLTDIDRPFVRSTIAEIKADTTDSDKGHRGLQSSKSLSLIRLVLEWAVENDHVPDNAARGIKAPVPNKNPAGKCSRPLKQDELRRVWNSLPTYCSWAPSVRVIRLSFVIGKRVSELVGALKNEIEMEEKTMTIPGHRIGNKSNRAEVVPLPDMAVSILAEAIAESGDSPFVFPSRFDPKKHMDRGTPSGHLQDVLVCLEIDDRIRFHDSRGLINDQMAMMQIPSEYRSHVLHHTGDMRSTLVNDTYSTYDLAAQKREALKLWEKRLLEIIEGLEPSGLNWRTAESPKVEELIAKLECLIEQQHRHPDRSSSVKTG